MHPKYTAPASNIYVIWYITYDNYIDKTRKENCTQKYFQLYIFSSIIWSICRNIGKFA